MNKLIFGLLLLASTAFGIYTEEVVTTNGTTNTVIHFIEDLTEFHCYWETGTYSSNSVAKFSAEDERRYEIYAERMERNGTNDWCLKQQQPRYSHITTNTVHWMKAHPATTNDLYIIAYTWHEWGYVNLYWKENLTDPTWERIIWGKQRHDPRVYARTKIHMHPESSITKRMLKAKTGFFCQSVKGPYTFTSQRGTDSVHENLYKVDLSNFLPEPEPLDVIPNRGDLGIDPVVSNPPPVPNGTPVETYWLNTSSGTRHNSSCRYYENTKQGVPCNKDDGTACKTCDG